MSVVTKGEFFQEKLFNFLGYTLKTLTNPKYNSFVAKISSLEQYSVTDAISYFSQVVAPTGVFRYIEKLLQEVNLRREDFEREHLDKLEQYLQCFVSIVSS